LSSAVVFVLLLCLQVESGSVDDVLCDKQLEYFRKSLRSNPREKWALQSERLNTNFFWHKRVSLSLSLKCSTTGRKFSPAYRRVKVRILVILTSALLSLTHRRQWHRFKVNTAWFFMLQRMSRATTPSGMKALIGANCEL
jgi:hypothetical protein